jgi:AcrR family transcriptional regulator
VSDTGLRERKKLATRQALGDAALRLAADRGLEHLTVEDISEAAGVSTRTFFNYFCGKEEAIIGDTPLLVIPEPAALVIRDGETVLDGLHRVIRAGAEGTACRRDEVRLRRELMERYPALMPRLFSRLAGFERSLAAAVAASSGTRPCDAYPQLMAAIAFTAVRVAINRWSTDNGDRMLEHHLDEMFGLLKAEAGRAGAAALDDDGGNGAASRAHLDSTQEERA